MTPTELTEEQLEAAEKAYAKLATPAWTSNKHRPALAAAIRAALQSSGAAQASEPDQPPELLHLLRLTPQTEPVYFVLRRPDFGLRDRRRAFDPALDNESQTFFFDEHSCPTNWINHISMISVGGDHDPHGLLEHVRTVPAPAQQDEPEDEDDLTLALFPELVSPPAPAPDKA